jgi:hypothetical protein
MQLPDPLQGPEILENLKQEISTAYNTLKDSPGRKTIGFLCGHEEFCPFAETDSKIPDELVQAFAQQPFIKKAVDDIKGLEQRLNQHNEAIRGFFVSRGYRVVQAAAGAPVSDEVDALIVFGPRTAFSDLDLYDLDQYILTGKPVVFFIANYNVEVNQWDDEPPYNLVRTIESTDTNINPFLAHYGIQNNTDLVMETQRGLYDVINTVVMQMSNLGELPMAAKYSYPLFPKFESFSDDDLLVAGLRRVTLPFVSSFSAADTAHTDLHFEPLISSTENAVSKTEAFDLNPQTLKDSIVAEQTAGVVHVAAHVTGTDVSSFFAGRERPERPAPAAASPDEPAPEVPDEAAQRDQGPVNIVVIGSTLGFENLSPSRILQDFNLGAVAQEKVTGLGAAIPYFIRYVNIWGRLIGQQNPIHFGERGRLTQLPGQQAEFLVKPDDKGTDSLDLLFSIFDWATGDIGLGQIRAKIDTDRPLRVEGEKQQQGVVGFLVFGLPLLLIILGFVRHSLRRMGRQRLSVTVSSEEA